MMKTLAHRPPVFLSAHSDPYHGERVEIYGPQDFEKKTRDAAHVYSILEVSYRGLGGINKGSGFKNPRNMVDSIPVWRVVWVGEYVASVTMFKLNGSLLKMVAYGTTDWATQDIKRNDIECFVKFSHAELSGPVLFKTLRQLGASRHAFLLSPSEMMPGRRTIPAHKFGHGRLRDEENGSTLLKLERDYPDVLPHAYVRKLGEGYKLKVLVGVDLAVEDGGLQLADLGVMSAYGSMFIGE